MNHVMAAKCLVPWSQSDQVSRNFKALAAKQAASQLACNNNGCAGQLPKRSVDSRKRARHAGNEIASTAAAISVKVVCMDGSSLVASVERTGAVAEIKQAIARWSKLHPDLIDLFVKGVENPLPGATRLHSVGIVNGSVVFMLQRQGKLALLPRKAC